MTVEKRIKLLKRIFDGSRFTYSTIGENIALLGIDLGDYFETKSDSVHERRERREENLSKGVIDLTKDDSLSALIFLLKDRKYTKKAFNYLRKVNIKTIKVVQELWKVYEEKHLFIHPNDLLLLLAKIEGKESKAFELLYEEKKYNRLWGDQLVSYEKLCLDFEIEEKFLKLREDAESKGQEETIVKIDELQEYVEERIGKTIGLFDKAIKDQDLLVTAERKEGLQKQIEQMGKRISDSFTNTRLFLIFISVIFTLIAGAYLGLTGWLISLLVKLIGS